MSTLRETNWNGSILAVGECVFGCTANCRNYMFYRSLSLTKTGDDSICLDYNRKGPMCGNCLANYAPPAYYYNLTCTECSDYRYNWMKYIAVAYLPLTAFYVLVLVFKVSATTGSMNALVTLCQLAATPSIIRFYFIPKHRREYSKTINIVTTVCTVWNLDFFRALYKPFCLHPSMTTIQVFTLDYGLGLYPLILIVVTYFFVKLHDRYTLVVSLWRPFNRCISRFTRTMNIKESLVQAFATFILLSYVKILNASFDILTPGQKYLKPDSQELDKQYWYYNGTLEYLGKEHIQYAVLAIIMSVTFNIIPLLLLILYPFRCFRRFLQLLRLESNVLSIFMETFCGCYRTKPNCRHFAVVYVLLRVANLILCSTVSGFMYFSCASYLFIIVLVLVAIVRPYRKMWHNIADIILFSSILSFYQFVNLIYESYCLTPNFILHFSMLSILIVIALIISVPGFWGILIFLWRIVPVKTRQYLLNNCVFCMKRETELEESLPHRLQQNNEQSPLLS